MPRQKKEYSPVSIKMNQDVFERLQAYSEKSGVPKTTVIERAVSRYISELTNATIEKTEADIGGFKK